MEERRILPSLQGIPTFKVPTRALSQRHVDKVVQCFEDRVSRCSPVERMRVRIIVLDKLIDLGYEFFDTFKGSPSILYPENSVFGGLRLDDNRWKSHCLDFFLTPVAV